MRRSMFDGKFYETSFEKLDQQINSCFNHSFGPGDLPISRKDNQVNAILVPHAGYSYSGPCAAWAYKLLAESKFPETYILIGLTHNKPLKGIFLSKDDWETPFGKVKTDLPLARELLEKCPFIKIDERIHQNEHSIEVQLPFLQFASRDKIKELKILPIIVSDFENYKELAEELSKLKNIILIISTDFTHFGDFYNYKPFKTNLKESLNELDKNAFKYILDLNEEGFKEFLNKTNITICGQLPILTLIHYAKLKKSEPRLLSYYLSGDLTKDYENSVSYASFAFEK